MNNKIKFFLGLIAIIGFFGGLHGSLLIVFSSLIVISFIFLAYFWNEYIFSKLEVNRSLTQSRVEFGKNLYYEIELENRKLLPVIWLKVEARITKGINFTNPDFLRDSYGMGDFNKVFQDFFSMKWYQKTKRHYQIAPQKRGLYRFGSGKLYYSGIFGLFDNTLELYDNKELIVYPRIIPLSRLGIQESQLFGSHRKEGWIFQDPLNKVGVRPYQNTDQMKQINWKASARHLNLESDIYKPSFDREVHLFLNSLPGSAWWQNKEQNNMELAIISAASIIDQAYQAGYKIGFYTNAVVKKEFSKNKNISGDYTALRTSHNQQQRSKLLTTLALLQPFGIGKLSKLMEREKQGIKEGSTVIVITSKIESDLNKILSYYNRYFHLILIKIEKKDNMRNVKKQGKLSGIKIYFIDEGEAWDEIKSLEFTQ